jgi:hypothetical protein
MINRAKLKADIHTNVAAIKEMKSRQRESHQPRWSWRDPAQLDYLKHQATNLYIFAASLRGKQHIKTGDEDRLKDMRETVEYMKKQYTIKEEQTSAPAIG